MPILTEDERIGTVLSGKYRVRSVLARGGMGVLFTGEHTWTGRPVAIKLLPPVHTGDKAATSRFLREGRAATTLRHPHVVEVLDMGQAEDGALFMVLELLEGIDLQAVRQVSGPMDVLHAIELLTPVVDALATVHERGFVHRDLKPSNIFMARQGDGRFIPTLLDFGIAKALTDDDASATGAGIIVGTPHYMAPEQATGTSEIGPPADVWALGVMMYELLSGCFPYDGASPTAILMAVLQSKHTPLIDVSPSVPPAVAAEIEAALVREPKDRPPDLRAWIARLRALSGMPPLALPLHAPIVLVSEATSRAISSSSDAHSNTDRPPPPVDAELARAQSSLPTERRRVGSSRWVALAGAAGALVLLVIVIAFAMRPSTPQPIAHELAAAPPLAQAPDAGVPVTPVIAAPDVTEVAATPVAEAEEDPTAGTPTPQAPSRTRPERVHPGETHGRGRRPIAEITTEW